MGKVHMLTQGHRAPVPLAPLIIEPLNLKATELTRHVVWFSVGFCHSLFSPGPVHSPLAYLEYLHHDHNDAKHDRLQGIVLLDHLIIRPGPVSKGPDGPHQGHCPCGIERRVNKKLHNLKVLHGVFPLLCYDMISHDTGTFGPRTL